MTFTWMVTVPVATFVLTVPCSTPVFLRLRPLGSLPTLAHSSGRTPPLAVN